MKPLISYFDATNLKVFDNFTFKTLGLLLVLGMMAGTYVATRKARRNDIQHELIFRAVVSLIFGIFCRLELGPSTLLIS